MHESIKNQVLFPSILASGSSRHIWILSRSDRSVESKSSNFTLVQLLHSIDNEYIVKETCSDIDHLAISSL